MICYQVSWAGKSNQKDLECYKIMSLAAMECGVKDFKLVGEICQAIDGFRASLQARGLHSYLFEEFGEKGVYALVAALIEKESCFNPKALSRAKAVGLMQIHYPYWKKRFPSLEEKSLFKPYFNVGFGLWLLESEFRRTGNLVTVLSYYGGFLGKYSKSNKKNHYIFSILTKKKKYQQLALFLNLM